MKLSTLINKMRIDRPDEWSMDELERMAIELEKQRDELLAALERLVLAKSEKDQHGDTPVYKSLKAGAWRAANEVIASVKGGAA